MLVRIECEECGFSFGTRSLKGTKHVVNVHACMHTERKYNAKLAAIQSQHDALAKKLAEQEKLLEATREQLRLAHEIIGTVEPD